MSEKISEPIHPDFQRILRMFIQQYGEDKGRRLYYAWLNKYGLDDTKSLDSQRGKLRRKERFDWAGYLRHIKREDGKYYKVWAVFPIVSLNLNKYTEDELMRAARTLVGKPVNINHEFKLEDVEIIDAEYEDNSVECLIFIDNKAEFEGKRIIDMIDNEEIIHVSIEAICRTFTWNDEGRKCEGLIFSGLALLTRDAFPGIPLTRIEPFEKFVHEHFIKEVTSLMEKIESELTCKEENENPKENTEIETQVKTMEKHENESKSIDETGTQPEAPQVENDLKIRGKKVKEEEITMDENIEPKGIVETEERSEKRNIHMEKLIKEIKSLKTESGKVVSWKVYIEQYMPPVGQALAPAAKITDFVMRSPILVGERGDTVTVPYVKDFDMDILTNVGDTLTAKTGLYGTVATTLKEAAFTTTIPYADVEKLGPEIIEKIETAAVKAARRAVDKHILDTFLADTNVPELDKSGTAGFDADWVAEAIQTLMSQGKDVEVGDLILVIDPMMYGYLLKDIAGTQALTYVRGDIVRTGVIRDFLGCNIVISNYLPEHDGTNHYRSAYLIHKNALVFAPKRELLLEMEKDTAARKNKLTGSHTFGIAVVDNKAVVEIKTQVATV